MSAFGLDKSEMLSMFNDPDLRLYACCGRHDIYVNIYFAKRDYLK